jgi:hypothetical protein
MVGRFTEAGMPPSPSDSGTAHRSTSSPVESSESMIGVQTVLREPQNDGGLWQQRDSCGLSKIKLLRLSSPCKISAPSRWRSCPLSQACIRAVHVRHPCPKATCIFSPKKKVAVVDWLLVSQPKTRRGQWGLFWVPRSAATVCVRVLGKMAKPGPLRQIRCGPLKSLAARCASYCLAAHVRKALRRCHAHCKVVESL